MGFLYFCLIPSKALAASVIQAKVSNWVPTVTSTSFLLGFHFFSYGFFQPVESWLIRVAVGKCDYVYFEQLIYLCFFSIGFYPRSEFRRLACEHSNTPFCWRVTCSVWELFDSLLLPFPLLAYPTRSQKERNQKLEHTRKNSAWLRMTKLE